MSQTTTLVFARPTKPPIVTGPQLADFVDAVANLGILANPQETLTQVRIKHGKRIDSDKKPSSGIEDDGTGRGGWFREITWDVKNVDCRLDDALRSLREKNQPVYRGSISLGTISKNAIEAISRVSTPRDKHDLELWDFGVQLEPQVIADHENDIECMVGWMSVTIWGYGLLYPWKPADMMARITAQPLLAKLADLCRKTWPVTPEKPSSKAIRNRTEMPSVWIGQDFDAPYDWRWFINESF